MYLALCLIQSVSSKSSGPSFPTATPGVIGVFLLLVLLVFILASLLLICIKLDILPTRILPAGRQREKPGRVVCPNCGYDLRASPIRCPECGQPRRVPESASPSRILRRVEFQAGRDVLEITVSRELSPCIEEITSADPLGAELLFATTGKDGPETTTAEQLRDAAEQCVNVIRNLHPDPAGHGPTLALLNRIRQFARTHPYAHIIRTVHGSARSHALACLE